MALKRVKCAPVVAELSAELAVNSNPPQVYEAPGGLFPLRARAFEMDTYRLMAGWPVAVPKYDIFARSMVSGAGETLVTRENPVNIKTGALARWVANSEFVSTSTLRWNPVQDNSTGMFWQSSSNYMPVLISEYTYRLGTEVFIHEALNFDSDAKKHMWANFDASLGGSNGYTVIMVMNPNSVYGNDETVPYNGLWCPGDPSPGTATFVETLGDHWVSVRFNGRSLYYGDEGREHTRSISIAKALEDNIPMYLAMVFDRPDVVFYVGEGPSSERIRRVPASTSDPVPLSGRITLGRSPGDVLHTADMALFDLGVYGERLNPAQIAKEFALLSQAYGGVEK